MNTEHKHDTKDKLEYERKWNRAWNIYATKNRTHVDKTTDLEQN